MIEELDKWKKAGRIAAEARDYGKQLIKPGVKLVDVADKVEEKIFQLGAKPAFPVQISLNHVAAHSCPSHNDGTIFKEGDLVKLDVGAHVDGYIGDTAVTVDLGDNKELALASEYALSAAIDVVQPGITLGEVGRAIQATIIDFGFSPVTNLGGHVVGRFKIHGKPAVPNYDTHDPTQLEKDQIIAIEPFATNGEGRIYEETHSEIFQVVSAKPGRNQVTREIFKEIGQYEGLPFTTRWLTKKFSLFKVNVALKELLNSGAIKAYPPLSEKAKGLVSQAEHTIIVSDPVIILTKI